MRPQTFALIAGAIYIAVGIFGFIPGLVHGPVHTDLAVDAGHGLLFGIFPVNVLHNIVHLAIGVWGLVASKAFDTSRSFSRGLAIIYGVLAIMGLFPVLNTFFGLVPLYGHDIWLHAITAVIAAYFGWAKVPAGPRTQFAR